MELNDFDEEGQIVWNSSPSLNSDSYGSPNGEIFEIDSSISQESSPAVFNDFDNYSEQSNESGFAQTWPINPIPTLSPKDQELLDYLIASYNNPKQIADLNSKKGAKKLGELVAFINQPNALQLLQACRFTEYNNQIHDGVYIQLAAKEFKSAHGFDEANFPFKDSGGPQKAKLADNGYIYKYWVGKFDNSLKMRKFYKENGVAIIVVFREETSPGASPSSSSEISVNAEPANKKARVGGSSPFSSSSVDSEVSSPTRLSNTSQHVPYGSNSNNGSGSLHATSTNYSQQPTLNGSTATISNNTNYTSPNPLHSPEHLSDRIDSISLQVNDLANRMVKVELNTATSKAVTMTPYQCTLGKLIIRVLRENGGRHQMGKPLATKVRKLLGGTLDTKDVNNTLYTVLAPLGIAQLQDKEWVLIDETKAQEFEQQQ